MPPQSQFVNPTTIEDELAIIPDNIDDEDGLEERKLSFNVKEIIHTLRNIDKSKIVWRNVILFIVLHIYSLYGVYLAITSCMWKTLLLAYFLHYFGAMGITMGVHRLWAHRSFKAKFPLRFILALAQTVSFQNSIYEWSRDHRVHHKYSETDADPHSAKRGFFFSHMGWLMMKKHPQVKEQGKKIKLDDLLNDPIVYYQHKYYKPLVLTCCFIIPTAIPMYFWNESFLNGLFVPGFLRYVINLHVTWLVNSLAHFVGSKPFDRGIYPVQNRVVAWFAMGEGWHNYHHVFPYDYRAAELGGNFKYNVTTLIIDFFAKIGWVYDRKLVSEEMATQRALRTGDGSKRKKSS